MSAYERTFATFELGDNVYELSNELIPRIAESLEVRIADEPNQEDLQTLVTKFGVNKVLRDNEEVTALSREQMADFLDESGMQLEMNRSLWTPRLQASPETVDAAIAMTGVANWQDRGVNILSGLDVPVWMTADKRVMDSPTERPNANVQKFERSFGRYPTEAEYAGAIVVPQLVDIGRQVTMFAAQSSAIAELPESSFNSSGDKLLRGLFQATPDLEEKRIAVARVANAGVLMAAQVRAAARTINPNFDKERNDPQLFIVTDDLKVSRTDQQDKDSVHFQKAQTGLRQVLLTAKQIDALRREASGNER